MLGASPASKPQLCAPADQNNVATALVQKTRKINR